MTSFNEPGTRPGGTRSRAVLSGWLAAAVALGIAELGAGLFGVRSPVIAVGDTVIDYVPSWAKNFAIETFGTNDKPVLLLTIGLGLLVLAALIGLVARRSLKLAAVGLALFAAVGVFAGARTPDAVLPSILITPVGCVAGFFVLRRLHGAPKMSSAAPAPIDDSRRVFLKQSAIFLAVAAVSGSVGRYLISGANAVASRAAVLLPRPARALEPLPTNAVIDVDGVRPFVTANADFYRIDTALAVPQVDAQSWSLSVKGMVERELTIPFNALLERPLEEFDITMTCVSNVVGGDLIGNARWLGVPLRTLLEEAGVDPNRATQVVGRSVDGYTCGFPTAAVYDGRNAIVAVGMNGEPLPLEHGFPARLVVAGLYGYVSATKWLQSIELTTLEGFDSYWVPRGYAKQAPIKTQSRIDTPKGFARIPAGRAVAGGSAWSQPTGIERVELRVDNGPWSDATLAAEVNNSTWRQWRWEWDATPGLHNLYVRATDKKGVVQTDTRRDPLPDGATGWHSVSVTVT